MVENLDTKIGEVMTIYGSGPMAAKRNVLEMARMKWKTNNVQIVPDWRERARKAKNRNLQSR